MEFYLTSLVLAVAVVVAAVWMWFAFRVVKVGAIRRTSILRLLPLQWSFFGMTMLFVFGVFLLFGILGWQIFNFISEGSPSIGFTWVFVYGVAVMALGFIAKLIQTAADRQMVHAQKARDEQARLVFEHIRGAMPLEKPLFVYLHPFPVVDASTLSEKLKTESELAPEELVIELFEQWGTLICVDEPGFQYGAGRLQLRDDKWQPSVLLLCELATCIIICPGAGAGVLWELQQISSHGWLDRTLFLMPPIRKSEEWQARLFHSWIARSSHVDPKLPRQLEMQLDIPGHWERARTRARGFGLNLPEYRSTGGIFRIVSGKVEWVTVFAHDIFSRKPPKKVLESVGPVIDSYVSRRSSVPEQTSGNVLNKTRL